jgi:molybdate transport system substrate-binding protein
MYDRIRRLAALATLLAGALVLPFAAQASGVPNIAVASDLQFALPEIVAAFERATGHAVRLSFGSSGNFRRQIADGAPFDLFLSADASYADALVRERRTLDAGVVYAIGRLALFVANDSPITPDPQLHDVAAALADGRLSKFAIANPEHAPYGRAAQQVLTRGGLWKTIEPHLVLGENVSQAAQFAASGAAQGGIIAYSLVRAPGIATRGRYALLPTSGHDPLVQKMVLLRRANATARAFYTYLQQPVARAIFERYGFDLPPRPAVSAAEPPQGANSAPAGGSAAAKPQAWGDHTSTAPAPAHRAPG